MKRARFREGLLRYGEGVHELGQPARAEAVAAAEKRCGFPLPPSFREFLRDHDGGGLFHEAYVIWPAARIGPHGFGSEGDATLSFDARRARSDGEMPVVRFEPGAGERFTVGSRFDRWLEAVLAREDLVYDADGEFKDVFEEHGPDLRPEVMRRREERALRADPDAPATHYELARLHARDGRLPAAVACLERAVALEPTFLWAHFEMGRLQRELGRPVEAMASFERAASLDPEQAPVAYAWAARIAAERGDRNAASRLRARVRLLDPGFARRHREIGRILLEAGDGNAADMLALALAIDPGDAEAGEMLRRAGGQLRDRELTESFLSDVDKR
jgi:tetratricopeptide (TPR) repeat protein